MKCFCKEEVLFHLLFYYLVLTCGFFNCQEEIRRHTLECLEKETIKKEQSSLQNAEFSRRDYCRDDSTDLTSSEKTTELNFLCV